MARARTPRTAHDDTPSSAPDGGVPAPAPELDAPTRLPVMAALEYEGLDYGAPTVAPVPPPAQPTPPVVPAAPPAALASSNTAAPAPASAPAPDTPAGYLARVQHGQYRPFGSLNLDPLNPRTISPEMLDRLMGSIREFGFVEPVVVRPEDGLVVGGHQRMEALRRLMLGEGKTPAEIAATLVPVAVLPPGVSDAHTRALNVGLNRISGSWDYDKLNVILSELRVDLAALDFAGFSLPEVDDIAASLASIHHSSAVTGAAAGAAGFAAFGGGSAAPARGGFGALDGTAGEAPRDSSTAPDGAPADADGVGASSTSGDDADAGAAADGNAGTTRPAQGSKGAPDPLDPYTIALDTAGASERDGRPYRRVSLPYPVLPRDAGTPSAEALHGWVVALGFALAECGHAVQGHAGVEAPEGAPHPPWSVLHHALRALSAELGVPVPTGDAGREDADGEGGDDADASPEDGAGEGDDGEGGDA